MRAARAWGRSASRGAPRAALTLLLISMVLASPASYLRKQAKTELAQALSEAAKASEDTHGASESDALKPTFGKMLNGVVNETKVVIWSQPRLLLSRCNGRLN